MKKFLDEHFLLQTETSQQLYHEFAAPMPVIDYHCHLPVQQIADDINFSNLTQIWLHGDHYKWRAMRTNGVDESYITGSREDKRKFEQWAATVPYTLRNPLYHWTHLELQRYFDIHEVLHPGTASNIYDACAEKLQSREYSVRNLLRRMNVELVCTTDDPLDSLQYHQRIREDGFEIKVFPAFRPDKALQVEDVGTFKGYLRQLEAVSQVGISSFGSLLDALKQRHDFFASMGCSVADHGLEYLYCEDASDKEADAIFKKINSGRELTLEERLKLKSAVLHAIATWNHEKGWVQQYHLGALRNNNSRMLQQVGPDAGGDSIGDFPQGISLSKFLNKLDAAGQLTKTILYNLNPADNEVLASMTGNFNDGSVPGKIQFGAAWWFLDQKDGMTRQMNALSNMGLLSKMVGMITDSRSFMSYPRHEYFRRLLCNLFGDEMEKGELPCDIQWTGKIIRDICYYNAKGYFGW